MVVFYFKLLLGGHHLAHGHRRAGYRSAHRRRQLCRTAEALTVLARPAANGLGIARHSASQSPSHGSFPEAMNV
jgi:hypothetical protein